MAGFLIQLFLHIVAVAASNEQTDKFDYECDVLTRLDRLEHELEESTENLESVENEFKVSTEKLESVENELKVSTEKLESVETELKVSTEKLESVENELKSSTEKLGIAENDLMTANESQVASDIKLAEAVDEILSLKIQLEERTTTGSTYVRWGRTTCPGNGTELVYAGFAGGSHYASRGAAVNYLCLPKTPLYGKYNEDAVQTGGAVFRVEYKLYSGFFPDIDQSTVLRNNDVPCAVCRTNRPSIMMLPARYTCMEGWTLEYKGLLVSGYRGHFAGSEFVCLDDQPESIVLEGSGRTKNGAQLYLVRGGCIALQCPPYVNGRELTCAVCSK